MCLNCFFLVDVRVSDAICFQKKSWPASVIDGDLARATRNVRLREKFPLHESVYTQRNLEVHFSLSMTTAMPHCQMVTPIIRPCPPSSCPSTDSTTARTWLAFCGLYRVRQKSVYQVSEDWPSDFMLLVCSLEYFILAFSEQKKHRLEGLGSCYTLREGWRRVRKTRGTSWTCTTLPCTGLHIDFCPKFISLFSWLGPRCCALVASILRPQEMHEY